MIWIIENSMRYRCKGYRCNAHLIIRDLFEQKHFNLLDLAISTFDKIQKQVKYCLNYDPRFHKTIVGFKTGSIELLLYIVPDIISACHDEGELGMELEIILANTRRHHGSFSGLSGFKYICENKLFDITDCWYKFSDLPEISTYIKENNIPFDMGDYILQEIELDASDYDLEKVKIVLQNLNVDINTLECSNLLYSLWIEENLTEEGIVAEDIQLMITRLLKLGLNLQRLGHIL